MSEAVPKIVVVGGGAGGLELVTKLGKNLARKRKRKLLWLAVLIRISGNLFYMKLPPVPSIPMKMKLNT